MMRTRFVLVAAAIAAFAPVRETVAQAAGFDEELVAFAYHKVSGDPLDLRRVAERSEIVTRASNFDKPDMVKQEMARLQALLAAAGPQQEFTMRVNDAISDYDHQRGEFSITLFTPGYYVPVSALAQQYQLVFANAESARPIPMNKEEARDFDIALTQLGRSVTNELKFRVIGRGDPAGAVTGQRVIRAEIVSSRLLDRGGNMVWTPNVAPVAVASSGTKGVGADGAAAFDLNAADVAGFRVGVDASDLEATLVRLFGPVTRRPARRDGHPGIAAQLLVNDMGCMSLPGRRNAVGPGSVCVTALLDADDVVRAISIERVFPWMEAETFRKTLVTRYGPVTEATGSGRLSLGWGPEVPELLLYDRSGPRTALTAHYSTNEDFMSVGLNRLSDTRVVLQLVDARWATGQR